MFQCLGLATEADGGCGEDWWHPECVVCLGRDRAKENKPEPKQESGETSAGEEDEEAEKLPPGFPHEDDFETFICYKCVNAHPWIRRYAGSPGFLPGVYRSERQEEDTPDPSQQESPKKSTDAGENGGPANIGGNKLSEPALDMTPAAALNYSRKRKAEDTADESTRDPADSKRAKTEPDSTCHYDTLPGPSPGKLSLFLREDFRDHLCRCPKCYPTVSKHPQLLDEEESYEPPLSEDGEEGNRSAGNSSLLDRGEAALSNVDRVRAIGTPLASAIYIVSKLTAFREYRRCHGLQPPQGQGEELPTALRRKRPGCWGRRHQGVLRKASRR